MAKSLHERVEKIVDDINKLEEDVRTELLTEFDSEQEKKDHEEVAASLHAVKRTALFALPVDPISIPSDGTEEATDKKSERS